MAAYSPTAASVAIVKLVFVVEHPNPKFFMQMSIFLQFKEWNGKQHYPNHGCATHAFGSAGCIKGRAGLHMHLALRTFAYKTGFRAFVSADCCGNILSGESLLGDELPARRALRLLPHSQPSPLFGLARGLPALWRNFRPAMSE